MVTKERAVLERIVKLPPLEAVYDLMWLLGQVGWENIRTNLSPDEMPRSPHDGETFVISPSVFQIEPAPYKTQVLDIMEEEGHRPAGIEELLAFHLSLIPAPADPRGLVLGVVALVGRRTAISGGIFGGECLIGRHAREAWGLTQFLAFPK